MVLNEPRTEPFSASQFQPPSSSCSFDQAVDDARDVLPEVGAQADHHAVDARLDLALEERLAGVLPAAVLPTSSTAGGRGRRRDPRRTPGAGRGCTRSRSTADPPRGSTGVAARPARGTTPRLPTGRRRPGAREAARPSPPRPPSRARWRRHPLARRTGRAASASGSKVRLEQPLQRRHGRSLPTRPKDDPAYRRVDATGGRDDPP